MQMQPERIAAFAMGDAGGNPAGVVIADRLPGPEKMQRLAREIGYSETAFAAPDGAGWQVRYFAPGGEVAFCGHATIALGAVLGRRFGAGTYELTLSQGRISVTATEGADGWQASLQSPATWSRPLDPALTRRLMALFDLTDADLDPRLPPRLAFAGVRHAVLTLRDRARLARMAYDFDALRELMAAEGLTTVSLLTVLSDTEFASRNAFAIGGVVEDPATGAAAAALGGALVDIGWPALSGGGRFTIRQGEDMGAPSVIAVAVMGRPGDSVQVSGAVRDIAAAPADAGDLMEQT
jgi:PhzF family phenazine biosynthesis protein